MRKSIQGIVITGLMTLGFSSLALEKANAQKDEFYWGNPDIPYIEQRGFSLGVNIGMSELWSDLGTYNVLDRYNNTLVKDDILGTLRGMGGFFVRYSHVPGVAFRLGINYGKLHATDEWNYDKAIVAKTVKEDPYQRYLRNLDVQTSIWEANLMFEFAPLRAFSNWEFSKAAKMRTQPYILLGASGFHFNPRGTYYDIETGSKSWVDLRPLRTEGQGYKVDGKDFPETYSMFSYAALGGVGVKWDIGKGLTFGVEYQFRYTFTDYLDDVSGQYIDPIYFDIAYLNQKNKNEMARKMADRSNEIIPGYKQQPYSYRGDPTDVDKYSTLSLMFAWKIKWREVPWWQTYQ